MGEVLELPHVPKTRQSPKPKRLKNEDLRPREWLEQEEVERLIKAAGRIGRHRVRDALMIRMAEKHGLRASELCNLKWVNFDFDSRNPKVKIIRLKDSENSTHFLNREEIIGLKKMRDLYPGSHYVFGHERGSRISPGAFWKIVKRAGIEAGFSFPVHPHQLRHACGYRLTNEGKDSRSIQAYMGHKKPENAMIYTKMSPERFRDF
jgi:type 1 fimbriae regulatory protein FimE